MLLLHSTYSCECSTKNDLPFSETQYEIGKTFIFPRSCIEDPSFILFLIIMIIGILFLLVCLFLLLGVPLNVILFSELVL